MDHKPLFLLGVLGVLFIMAAAFVFENGKTEAENIRAKAKQDVEQTIAEGKAAFDKNEKMLTTLSEDYKPLHYYADPRMTDGYMAGAEVRAALVEKESQTWAAILGILGLILAVLGFSYSRP